MTNGYGIPTNKYEELSQLFYGYEEYLYNQREEYLQEYIETKTLIDNIEEQDSCIRNFIKGWLLSLKCLKKHQIFSDNIQLLITDDCQLKCLHCYNQNFERTHKHLSLDEVKDMITKFDSIGEYIDIRTGKRRFALCGGEPTLNPNLLEICDYLNEEGHAISLLTNGIYLSDEYIQRFKTYKDFMIQVSIDGMRNIHDSIRGTGTFDKSVETIEWLNKNGIKLVISFTANSMNYKEFPKVFDFFSKYENVYNIWCDRCVCESNFGINPLDKKQTITFIKNVNKIYSLVKNRINISRSLMEYRRQPCTSGNGVIIDIHGNLKACGRWNVIIANLHTDTPEEIAKKFKMFVIKYRSYPVECLDCPKTNICSGGCPAISMWEHNKTNIKESGCDYVQFYNDLT